MDHIAISTIPSVVTKTSSSEAATVRGAAAMVLQGKTHPTELRDQVCSPGGATIRAVNHLAAKGFNSAVIEAEIAAYERSVELGKA